MDETHKLREEILALQQKIRDMAAASPGAHRCKRNLHGGSTWEDRSEDYERSGKSGRYHDRYGSYGHELPGWAVRERSMDSSVVDPETVMGAIFARVVPAFE